jgi:hypothetical protein
MLDRRAFLLSIAAPCFAEADKPPCSFETDNEALQKKYDAALSGLRANIKAVNQFASPVLIEGATYDGVWLECAPLEGLAYAPFDPAIAVADHRTFFHFQRDDGYFPCSIRQNRIGTGQIQMVVPIAATALETYQITGDRAFLVEAYEACSRWERWLMKYRDTRGAGLCEAFCEYDTGHDNSPRFKGIPKKCPDDDARKTPDVPGLPYLAPDLSATCFGARVALARMAAILEKQREAASWGSAATKIRTAILDRLWDPETACFYDRDASNRFVRVRGDALTRVLGEHVVDQGQFEEIWRRQIHNPRAFWPAYPLPSIALDDPAFVRPIPRNSWGGASQALTALRAPRWMEHYGKYSALTHLMTQWVSALVRAPDFLQQMDPLTGEFTPDKGRYSPAMLVMTDFVSRLYGVRFGQETVEWNCRLPEGATRARFAVQNAAGRAELMQDRSGAQLVWNGRTIRRVRSAVRVVTDHRGRAIRMIGTDPLAGAGGIQPDQTMVL